ncbi:MAG: histidine kinase [Clostridia bacterium]|nr:histidine kinase [Clostridia bacterium]
MSDFVFDDNGASNEAIVKALYENYESIYAIDALTSAYRCFHESDSYRSLKLAGSGEDFFGALKNNIPKLIYEGDREYVLKKLSKENLFEGLERAKYYEFVYRLNIDSNALYHKLRATKALLGGRPHILIGIMNVDMSFRRDRANVDQISSMQSKEKNLLDAILASADGYIEANLTKDLILSISPYQHLKDKLSLEGGLIEGEPLTYTRWAKWICDTMVVEGKERFVEIGDRGYLINCFEQGERRASVSFTALHDDGRKQPCRKVFYLYRDEATKDILSFGVIYDLTQQQRREKELEELQYKLQMSRIRNFTSQMQPHFLYNALGSIQEIILENPEYASDLLGDFTIHLRSCIRAMSNDAPISFRQELSNIRAYVNIEKMRLGEKLKVIYDISAADFDIVPLSIQPLVENAIRHGIYGRGERGGTLTLTTEELDDRRLIRVEDDGVGFDASRFGEDMYGERTESTGIRNITFRLEKMMGAEVRVESEIGVGTRVTVSIPKEPRE